MNISICCLSAKYIHASLAPWCLYSAVKKNCDGIYAKVTESTINADLNETADKILSEKPDIISLTAYIWNIDKTLELCKILKQKTNAIIILGGPEVSYRPKDVLSNHNYIEYVLSGEGEETFPLFVNKIKNTEDVFGVAGLSYRKDKNIISNPEENPEATPPSPYCDEFFENLKERISYIETSRGCPYRCAFCLSGRCSDLRFFDIDQVKKDILRLSGSGTKTIKFVDRTFNANTERADEIISFILREYGKSIPQTVCFHFEIAGDILKESTFELLKKAPLGLFQLEIGMQSFNEETLKAINRKTNTQKLIKNIKRLVNLGNMHIHIDLIAGLTGEDFGSFRNSFNIGYRLKANMLQMGFLKLLHGSDMREYPEKYPCKFNEKPPYEVISTPWLSEDEIVSLKNCEDALDRLYNSGRFLYTLDYLTDKCNIEPFILFYEFGNMINGCKMSLTHYSEHLYHFFKNQTDPVLLQEHILCDLLCCSSSLQVPDSLKPKTPQYRQAKRLLSDSSSEKIKVGVLPALGKIIEVNQSAQKDFSGRYPHKFHSIDIIKSPAE